MVKEFNSLEDAQKYYDAESNTYIFKEFKEDEKYIRLIIFNFNFNVEANIDAWTICAKDINAKNINAFNIFSQNIHAEDIKANNIKSKDIHALNIQACNINAHNINACDITAHNIRANDIEAVDIKADNIKAHDINYNEICFAYNNIKCKSITGGRRNAKHFVFDGALEIEDE